MDRWDRELCWRTSWDIPWCHMVSLRNWGMGSRGGTESYGEGHHGTCSVVSLGNWGMGWTGWTRSFAEEICVNLINESKKQADLKSTIQRNKPLREATLQYEWWNRFTRSCLKEFSTVLVSPYTGSLETPPVTPPVGNTEDIWNRGLCPGKQYDIPWCLIYPLGIEKWDGKVQKWQVSCTHAWVCKQPGHWLFIYKAKEDVPNSPWTVYNNGGHVRRTAFRYTW